LRYFQLLPFCFVLFLTGACNSGDDPITSDDQYFPLQTGMYQIYDVDEIRYELGIAETLHYELKTVVADSFKNAAGTYTYVINRSKKDVGQTQWETLETWSAYSGKREVVVSEGNTPFVVLTFPLT
jgi:hypothetical protein